MTIAFICVNYNNSVITKTYLNSVLKINKINDFSYRIIVVDNDSNPDQIDSLKSFIKEINNKNIELIISKTNVGYFRGLNLGLNSLDLNVYNYVVIGNNDIEFQNDFLQKLEDDILTPQTFVLAPNIIRKRDGIHQNPHIVKKFTFFQNLYRFMYFQNYYLSIVLNFLYGKIKSIVFPENRPGSNKEQEIIMGYGACYVLTKNFFKVFSELDAPVFLMGEEGILSNQVFSANGVIKYKPSLIISHLDHASLNMVQNRALYNYSKISYKYYQKKLKHLH